MMNIHFALRPIATAVVLAAFLTGCGEPDAETSQPQAIQLYMDVHDLGPGNVKAEGVAKAHAADLSVQQRHGVQFIRYWVDELHGKVYCLSRAPGPDAIVETHREAHGLLPDMVGLVTEGQ